MPSLSYFLDRTKQLCESILSLKFQSPGIFTNSFIKEPSITSLLKDAEEHEQALYKINKPTGYNNLSKSLISNNSNDKEKESTRMQLEMKPERIDGKSYYVDYSFNDFTNLNVNNKQAPSEQVKRTAVRIPEIVKESVETFHENNDVPNSPEKIINVNLIPESIIHSDNINDICETILGLIRRYPNLLQEKKTSPDATLLSNIVEYHKEYNTLINEINELEEVVAEQKDQLNFYNINLSERSPIDRSPTRGNKRSHEESSDITENSDDNIDIDELIAQEEREIQELEDQLTKRQKISI
ncbi:uncharacterized protein AC631_05709 [Debaryomyces fabryi]|uniref:DASH complex subunit SPC34 n=1 Tax=Debaryomyces fabryi TaxID=58627 RepID=A0A0V1PQV8_9ASCO|nr:uncharacterized protein AC631_05709 [Debaryomyces fabryi]KRZ98530.1 hypothetical protein AC631_05709 [Debaryomyces fabryi]CUM45847.1 unnamed protein product [Debaryomyces fabryi]